jgi:hypothetical protein
MLNGINSYIRALFMSRIRLISLGLWMGMDRKKMAIG